MHRNVTVRGASAPVKRVKIKDPMMLRIWMDRELLSSFKAKCAKRGRTMSEMVIDLLEGYVEFKE